MSIINTIRLRQATAVLPSSHIPPAHQPEMLYIGCVDARLDPINDIGIAKGKALIFRNIGAIVRKETEGHAGLGAIAQNTSIGAVIEFFLRHIPVGRDIVKHIVVSGHTDCGGLKACVHGTLNKEDHYLSLYLESLRDIHARMQGEAEVKGWNNAQLLHALEEESVRQSMRNLLQYRLVRQTLEKGGLELHGWVINTATQRISEMNPETLEFEPMVAKL